MSPFQARQTNERTGSPIGRSGDFFNLKRAPETTQRHRSSTSIHTLGNCRRNFKQWHSSQFLNNYTKQILRKCPGLKKQAFRLWHQAAPSNPPPTGNRAWSGSFLTQKIYVWSNDTDICIPSFLAFWCPVRKVVRDKERALIPPSVSTTPSHHLYWVINL